MSEARRCSASALSRMAAAICAAFQPERPAPILSKTDTVFNINVVTNDVIITPVSALDLLCKSAN